MDVVDPELSSVTENPFLVVRRYDRVLDPPQVRRLHQEDFCQIFGYPPTRKYAEEGGPTLAMVANALRRYSAQPARDVLQLVRWVIFCALSGNADGHAKNLSLLSTPAGRRLAPAYDLVCTHAYEALDRRLAFAVGGRRDPDRLRRAEWEGFAAHLEIRPRLVFDELERMLEGAEPALESALEQVDAGHARQRVERAVKKRLRALRQNLAAR